MLKTLRRLIKRRDRRFAIRRDLEALTKRPDAEADEYTTGFATCDDRSIVVHVYRMADRELASEECQLLDLSRNGVKLFISSRASIGEAIGLRIQFEEMGIDVAEAATVCWTGFRGDGNWIVGCALAQDLNENAFRAIIDSGYLERRDEQRKQVDLPAIIHRDSTTDAEVEVRLDDYSRGGFGMFVSESMEIGEPAQLFVPGDHESPYKIPVEVRWQKKSKFGFNVGCKFTEENGFMEFKRALALAEEARVPGIGLRGYDPSTKSGTGIRWSLLAVSALMFVAGMLLLTIALGNA